MPAQKSIAADATLTERQRTTLLQIYAAFQSENRAQAERDQATSPVADGDDIEHETDAAATPAGTTHREEER